MCFKIEVQVVTIYAFSIENFNRSQDEVDTLFALLRDKLKLLSQNEFSYTSVNKVRVKIIGNRSLIPKDILDDLVEIEESTNTPIAIKTLNVCFPYTSRDDIVHSMKSIASQYKSNEIHNVKHINQNILEGNMYMGPDSPPLDLLIRTSGHTRLSDFMLWQCNANCEVQFVNTLWPDFKFLSIVSILLKWSYYRTLELEQQSIVGKQNDLKTSETVNILKSLPPPPPFASVNQR